MLNYKPLLLKQLCCFRQGEAKAHPRPSSPNLRPMQYVIMLLNINALYL